MTRDDDLDPRRLEVAAHELGHAIAWHTAGLTAAEIHVTGHGDHAQGHVTLHPHTLHTATAVRGYLAGLLAGREVSVRWCAEHGLRHYDHTCQGDFDRVRDIRRTALGRHIPTRVARADAQRIIRARWALIVRLAPAWPTTATSPCPEPAPAGVPSAKNESPAGATPSHRSTRMSTNTTPDKAACLTPHDTSCPFRGASPHEPASVGSLFTGAGALCELAVAPLLGGRVVWHCEHEPPTKKNPNPTQAAARMLAHRFPNTPNLGDITTVDWATVPPVRVLTGGFPCTDVSTAGQQAGLRPGTRSGLWSHMAYAIGQLRPELVVIENVRGLASAPAHSDVEPCPWCVGDEPDIVAVRALGAVLGDLADLGYDAVWCGLRASDIGAPHPRFRFVILAAPANAGCDAWSQEDSNFIAVAGRGRSAADPEGERCGDGHAVDFGPFAGHGRALVDAGEQTALLPTPRATDGIKGGPNQRGSSGDLMLPSAVAALLPTPTATPSLDALAGELAIDWGKYAPAIRRWEQVLDRPAPHPTITGRRGGRKLNPALSEWMMGWPAGWVTDIPGLTPNEQLRLCGNGVVPHQIQTALRYLLPFLRTRGRWAA